MYATTKAKKKENWLDFWIVSLGYLEINLLERRSVLAHIALIYTQWGSVFYDTLFILRFIKISKDQVKCPCFLKYCSVRTKKLLDIKLRFFLYVFSLLINFYSLPLRI